MKELSDSEPNQMPDSVKLHKKFHAMPDIYMLSFMKLHDPPMMSPKTLTASRNAGKAEAMVQHRVALGMVAAPREARVQLSVMSAAHPGAFGCPLGNRHICEATQIIPD